MAYSWKGYLKFSLVSIPIRSHSAVDSDADEIHFNQLHDKCHNRIRYKKTCPVHGEVTAEVAPEAPKVTVTAQELKLTKSLLDVFYKKKLDLSEFSEQYTERVKELVAAKVAGKQIAKPKGDEGPHIINLMDALRKSVASGKSSPAKKPAPAKRKTAGSATSAASRPRKKERLKSSCMRGSDCLPRLVCYAPPMANLPLQGNVT
jgi:non-homologous end joining protein Ku